MSEVIDIRPEVASERLIDPHYIDCRIDQLVSECEKVGIPIIIALLYESAPQIRSNHIAFDNALTMSGLLDVAKDYLRGVTPMVEVGDDDEEDSGV